MRKSQLSPQYYAFLSEVPVQWGGHLQRSVTFVWVLGSVSSHSVLFRVWSSLLQVHRLFCLVHLEVFGSLSQCMWYFRLAGAPGIVVVLGYNLLWGCIEDTRGFCTGHCRDRVGFYSGDHCSWTWAHYIFFWPLGIKSIFTKGEKSILTI